MSETSKRALGTWTGTEIMTGPDFPGGRLESSGRLEVSEALGGTGWLAQYTQRVEGQEGLRCVTVHRLLSDGRVRMDWVPSEGASRVFSGGVAAHVLTLEDTDADGVTMRIVSDYSEDGRLKSRTEIQPPGGEAFTVFEAEYVREASNAIPRPFRVLLPVADIDRAVAFYEAVLGAKAHRASAGRAYWRSGGVVLVCYDPRADGDDRDAVALPEVTYLSAVDVEATRSAWEAAGGAFPPEPARFGREIVERPWGERSFYAEDPFGNPVCFVQRGTEYLGA